MRVFINYKQNVEPDHEFAKTIEDRLRKDGHNVFRDETDLKVSEEWPARLEKEVRACDAMVSVVSNASLRSLWVLNEIDLALKLQKRMVPVLLEELDESLRFQTFNTRFMAIQWIPKKGDRSESCQCVSSALKEVRLECFRDLNNKKLSEYGIIDGREVIETLFGVLYQSHWPAALLDIAMLQDSQKRINGEGARSLAESLRNHVESLANVRDQNASNARQQGDDERSNRLTWQVQRLKCLADILNTLIGAWNQNAESTRNNLLSQATAEGFVFDDSDGEQAFVSTDAPSIQGGRRTRPVPVGEIVRVVQLPKKVGGVST